MISWTVLGRTLPLPLLLWFTVRNRQCRRVNNVDDKMVVNDELERIYKECRITEVLPQTLHGGTDRLGRDSNLPAP